MKQVQRFDFAGNLRAPVRRPDGSVMFEGVAIEAGILEYRLADGGVRRELVPMDMLERTAGGLARVACTLHHPANGTEFVTVDNFDRYGVGDVDGAVEVVRDEKEQERGFVRVKTCLRRSDAIEAVQTQPGMSCGYAAETDETPGVHPVFGAYDAIQVDRTYNHLAVGVDPRCATATLRADGAAIVPPNQEPTVDLRAALVGLAAKAGAPRLDAADPDLVAQVTTILESLQTEKAELESDNSDMKAAQADMEAKKAELDAAIEKATGERDALQAELDSLKAADAEAAEKAGIAKADSLAEKLGVDVSKCDSLKARKLAIVQARGLKVDSAGSISDERLDGMYETVAALHADSASSKWDGFRPDGDDGGDAAGGSRTDSSDRFTHPYVD